ncbi:MAG: HAMP domain-containing histidine kinase [Actinobacteria bacterium]|nr:HAMP domain-containing histidine kinase [Actinomycetota bacterium]MCG2819222.1 HAMP domain-containing histidine kinase [Actinomycetes bacterium]MBU4218313.1 HAMP domain-containing histidine kinase [Actinomycetota bacterium]MBU4357873.1 HAMP domain-containing histidine kinase [Actinomycetota bacterium]MBU4390956.1 HAMP domain-containing histidine kinase [Actinomycetota bacterium]
MSAWKGTIIRAVVAACLVSLVVSVGLVITYRLADNQKEDYYRVRKIQVETAAAAVDYRDIEALKGTSNDIGTPAYEKLLDQLTRIKRSDPHIRFVYFMRPQDGEMIYLVNAEEPASHDYTSPGEVHEGATPEDFLVFEGKKPAIAEMEEKVTNKSGTWITANAFVLDKVGKPIALLGTDVDTDRALSSFEDIKHVGLLFNTLGAALLALVSLQWILWSHGNKKRKILRQEMEESLVKLNTELKEANKIKLDFIQLASHELRGPVNAVNIAIQTAEKVLAPKLDDEERLLMEVARSGSSRLIDLLNNLLDITRLEAGDFAFKPEDVDVCDLVNRTVGLYEPLAEKKGLCLSAEMPKGELGAFVDPHSILRVLENLVGNAIKFTRSGSILVSAVEDDGDLRFEVKDTGPGIPVEFEDEVFEKFARYVYPGEHATQKGSGMGLALCKGLVEVQGGRIWFETVEGKGTTFFFEVPRYQETECDEAGDKG